jgi:hypothetical protein
MISFALSWWPGVRASEHPNLAGACGRCSDAFYMRRWPSPDGTTGAVVLACDDEGAVNLFTSTADGGIRSAAESAPRARYARPEHPLMSRCATVEGGLAAPAAGQQVPSPAMGAGRVRVARWSRDPASRLQEVLGAAAGSARTSTRRRWRGSWARHTASMSGCSRSIATSARQSRPPPGRDDLPRSCTARTARDRSSAADRPRSRPVTRSVWVSTRRPGTRSCPVSG